MNVTLKQLMMNLLIQHTEKESLCEWGQHTELAQQMILELGMQILEHPCYLTLLKEVARLASAELSRGRDFEPWWDEFTKGLK